MKLKDYSATSVYQRLFVSMGIRELSGPPAVNFVRSIERVVEEERIDVEDQELVEKLTKSTIEINDSDIIVPPNELLEKNGRKICVYIRDQGHKVDLYAKKSGYRYHLCNCSTLQWMKIQGRQHRYLATRRRDGFFEVFYTGGYKNRKVELKLELCQNCISILKYKKIYKYPFKLKDFYEQYDSDVPKTIRYRKTVTEVQDYEPEWTDISREYRRASGYKCKMCTVDCSEKTELIQLHHIDGNKLNNKRTNLLCLCVQCHSEQPLHGYMKANPIFRSQIEQIELLRIKQGLSL